MPGSSANPPGSNLPFDQSFETHSDATLAAPITTAARTVTDTPADLPGTAAISLTGASMFPPDAMNVSTGQGSPAPDHLPVEISANFASKYRSQNETAILLRGDCEIRKGAELWKAPLIVMWEVSPPEASVREFVAYLESTSEATAEYIGPNGPERGPYRLAEFSTTGSVRFAGPAPTELPSIEHDPAFVRASERREKLSGPIRQAQFTFDGPFGQSPLMVPEPIRLPRRVTIGPRFLGETISTKAEPSTYSTPEEWVITITGGVNIVVDNVPLRVEGRTILTRIDLTADRAVIWTDANYASNPGGFEIDENTPFQVYLEGNIVVRQGTNVVRASHAFYDISQRRGLAINAEVRTFLPDYGGTLRLRAAEVRQYSENRYHARNGFVTTSQFGQPKYRVQASDIFLEERFSPQPGAIDPLTGMPDETTLYVTSLNNRIFVENVPIFAAPYLSGPAEDPNIPIRQFRVGYSGMFGFELETAWNLDGLLGLDLPPGVDWFLEADYFSERGPGIGTSSNFDFDSTLFGMPVHNFGYGQLYYINDHGEDNLGLGRRNLAVPDDNRGLLLFRDRTTFDPFTYAQFELGYVFNNDRNFLEQYFETEWDQGKDLENSIYLNHQFDNVTATGYVSGRTNDFQNDTNWLPKLDLYLLGEPIFDSPVVWSQHSSIGYGQILPADAPPDPNDPFEPLPYYPNRTSGSVLMTRHELSLPFETGPVHWTPYVLGEFAYWQNDFNDNDVNRWYGSAGIRGSVQFSKYMPNLRSEILGLNGLAHKVTFDWDYYYADATASLDEVPQYNAFDENAQERFRERYIPLEFGGVLPPMYDPRYYAVRSGAGRSVTASYHELVDAQHTLWLGMRNRWQTKVGPPEAPRIIDWMELDLGAAIFPNADDNFGETLGLLTGRYAWHVSPRTSLLANGVFDVFEGGQNVWDIGVLSQRSARGSIYLGYREVDVGPIESQLITGSLSYVMSPNLYVATVGAAFDISEGIDRGESLTITRIGEYYLLHFGLGYDRSRNNVGVALSLEPKFGSYGGSSMQLNSLLGIQ